MPERRADAAGDAPARRKRRSWARRKHLGLKTVGVAVVVLVLGVVAVVLTWDSGRPSFREQVAAATVSGSTAPTLTTPAPSDTASATPTATGSDPGGSPGLTVVRGAITAVGDGQWTVKATNGLDYTVLVSNATVLPSRRTFASFGVGDTVTARGTLAQGTITAQRITVPAATSSSPT